MKRLLIFAFIAVAALARASDDPAAAESTLNQLITADLANNYEAFVSNGTTQFQAAFSKTQFEASAKILNPILSKKHEMTYLGELHQRGHEVYLYRLHFAEGSDDILATLSLKDGKVGGILFR